QVPYFKIPLILASRIQFLSRRIQFIGGSPVIEYFTVRSARPFPDVPEVAFYTDDAGRFETDILAPYPVCILILRMDRHIQKIRIEADIFLIRQEIPCIFNRFLLEVITDRKVAEHLKESMVACSEADLFNIVRTDSFLCIHDLWILRYHPAAKISFQCCNTRVAPQQSMIVNRHKRSTRRH